MITFEDSPLSRHPYDLLVEAWILPSQSLALRAKRGDGIIAPPKDFKSWQPFPPADPIRSASTSGVTSVPAVPPPAAYRSVVLLLWALAVNATITCRGLFWDGSPFMANILDLGHVHDFYTARAHVDWVTQLPLLLLSELGVRDTRLLAMVYSAALFGLPTGLYHVALARVKRRCGAARHRHRRRSPRSICRPASSSSASTTPPTPPWSPPWRWR